MRVFYRRPGRRFGHDLGRESESYSAGLASCRWKSGAVAAHDMCALDCIFKPLL